jgi:hypothetical protein
MARTTREIASALEAFAGQDSGDLIALDALIVEAVSRDPDTDLDRALFGIFERFPQEDGRGVYWSIVHGLEGRGGYEEALLDSVRRSASPFALLMLNRIANDGQADCAGMSITSILTEVASSASASPEARQEAAEFLEHQRGDQRE